MPAGSASRNRSPIVDVTTPRGRIDVMHQEMRGLGISSTPAAAADTSQVSVVHGIPGQPVDVYVNGKKILTSFKPATVAGPLPLAAGTYDVALTKPGDPVGEALLEDKSLQVPGGKNLSLVAHLNGSGEPALTAYVNDTAMSTSRSRARSTSIPPTRRPRSSRRRRTIGRSIRRSFVVASPCPRRA